MAMYSAHPASVENYRRVKTFWINQRQAQCPVCRRMRSVGQFRTVGGACEKCRGQK